MSMYPLFHDGDVVYFQKTPFKKIVVNDFVVIKKNAHHITHRVVYKSRGKIPYIITKGDTNIKSDGKIYAKQLIGRVIKIKRNKSILNPQQYYLIQSTLYFQEIVRILNLLQRNEVDFVILKGLPLHLFYEKAYPKRIYSDCDILVQSQDFALLEKLFSNEKYTKRKPQNSGIHKNTDYRTTEYVFDKVIQGFSISFDVHLEVVFLQMNTLGNLDNLYPQTMIEELTELFLHEKKQITLHHQSFPVLTSEDLIYYPALHLYRHNYRGYNRYEFLDSILRTHSKFDYTKIANRIMKFKINNFVYPAFLLLQKYYQTPIPKSFLSTIKPTKQYLDYIEKSILPIQIFDDQTRIQGGIQKFKNTFFLSPNMLIEKLLVFGSREVLYSLFWVIHNRVLRLRRKNNVFLFQ